MVPSRSPQSQGDAENGGNGHADPTRVATDFFAALGLQDWDDAIGFMEPRSLVDFRASQLALFASLIEQRDAGGRARAELRSYGWSSDGEQYAEQLRRYGDVTLRAFPGAPSLRQLAELSAEVFAARYLAAGSGSPSAYRVIGHVVESDDIAHVIYRPILEGTTDDALRVAVVHLRRHDGHWCVLMSQELADDAFILFDLDDLEDSAPGDADAG
jgi:hypothetical protein